MGLKIIKCHLYSLLEKISPTSLLASTANPPKSSEISPLQTTRFKTLVPGEFARSSRFRCDCCKKDTFDPIKGPQPKFTDPATHRPRCSGIPSGGTARSTDVCTLTFALRSGASQRFAPLHRSRAGRPSSPPHTKRRSPNNKSGWPSPYSRPPNTTSRPPNTQSRPPNTTSRPPNTQSRPPHTKSGSPNSNRRGLLNEPFSLAVLHARPKEKGKDSAAEHAPRHGMAAATAAADNSCTSACSRSQIVLHNLPFTASLVREWPHTLRLQRLAFRYGISIKIYHTSHPAGSLPCSYLL